MKQEDTALLNSAASAYGFESRAPHHKITKELSEHEKLKSLGKIDSLGRTNNNYLSKEDWDARKQLILNSGVDLMKLGWKTKLEKQTGLTRRQICLTIEHFSNEFDNIVYRRHSNIK